MSEVVKQFITRVNNLKNFNDCEINGSTVRLTKYISCFTFLSDAFFKSLAL